MITSFWLNTMMRMAFSFGVRDMYLGLSSTAPDQYGLGVTEPSNTNYTRVKIAGFSSPENGEIHNSEAVVFPSSTSTWFTETSPAKYWCIFDSPNASGNLIASGMLSHDLTIPDDASVRIPAGQISITLNDYDTTVDHVIMLNGGEILTDADGNIVLFGAR